MCSDWGLGRGKDARTSAEIQRERRADDSRNKRGGGGVGSMAAQEKNKNNNACAADKGARASHLDHGSPPTELGPAAWGRAPGEGVRWGLTWPGAGHPHPLRALAQSAGGCLAPAVDWCQQPTRTHSSACGKQRCEIAKFTHDPQPHSTKHSEVHCAVPAGSSNASALSSRH